MYQIYNFSDELRYDICSFTCHLNSNLFVSSFNIPVSLKMQSNHYWNCCSTFAASVKQVDITTNARNILSILEKDASLDQRVTALKLLAQWTGKTNKNQHAKHAVPSRLGPREDEMVITQLLLDDYLREDFHFTPYSTISYVLPGELSCLRCNIQPA